MNKYIKYFIFLLNIIMLYLAYLWFNENKEKEPLILIISQVITLITILFEKNISNIFIKKIKNSKINIKKNDSTHLEDIKDSQIKIK